MTPFLTNLLYKPRRWWILHHIKLNPGKRQTALLEYRHTDAMLEQDMLHLERQLVRLDEENREYLVLKNAAPMPAIAPRQRVSWWGRFIQAMVK